MPNEVELLKVGLKGDVVGYVSASANYSITLNDSKNKQITAFTSLMIINDDTSTALTITVNGITQTVKAGEVLDENYAEFTTATITSTVAFRCWIRSMQ